MAARRVPSALCLAVAFALGGCAANSPQIPPGAICEVVSKAPFYKYGPAQTFGADEVLNAGVQVTMIERGFGFSRVMTGNGVTGYVSSDDITPVAPVPMREPKPVAKTGRKAGNRTYSSAIKRSDVQSTPGDPLFDINDVPMPMADPPKPQFRATTPSARPAPPPAPEKKPE